MASQDTQFALDIDDPAIRDLITGYLERRQTELSVLDSALDAGDFATLQATGHNLHGSGGAYGLTPVSKFGAQLESAAADGDAKAAGAALQGLRGYLSTVEITKP